MPADIPLNLNLEQPSQQAFLNVSHIVDNKTHDLLMKNFFDAEKQKKNLVQAVEIKKINDIQEMLSKKRGLYEELRNPIAKVVRNANDLAKQAVGTSVKPDLTFFKLEKNGPLGPDIQIKLEYPRVLKVVTNGKEVRFDQINAKDFANGSGQDYKKKLIEQIDYKLNNIDIFKDDQHVLDKLVELRAAIEFGKDRPFWICVDKFGNLDLNQPQLREYLAMEIASKARTPKPGDHVAVINSVNSAIAAQEKSLTKTNLVQEKNNVKNPERSSLAKGTSIYSMAGLERSGKPKENGDIAEVINLPDGKQANILFDAASSVQNVEFNKFLIASFKSALMENPDANIQYIVQEAQAEWRAKHIDSDAAGALAVVMLNKPDNKGDRRYQIYQNGDIRVHKLNPSISESTEQITVDKTNPKRTNQLVEAVSSNRLAELIVYNGTIKAGEVMTITCDGVHEKVDEIRYGKRVMRALTKNPTDPAKALVERVHRINSKRLESQEVKRVDDATAIVIIN